MKFESISADLGATYVRRGDGRHALKASAVLEIITTENLPTADNRQAISRTKSTLDVSLDDLDVMIAALETAKSELIMRILPLLQSDADVELVDVYAAECEAGRKRLPLPDRYRRPSRTNEVSHPWKWQDRSHRLRRNLFLHLPW